MSDNKRVTVYLDADTLRELEYLKQWLGGRGRSIGGFKLTVSSAVRYAVVSQADRVRKLEEDRGRAR